MSLVAGDRLTGRASMSLPAQPRTDERALLDLARAGDEKAFGQLLEHHRRGLSTLCQLMLGDDELARTVMSDVILVAWRERSAAEPSLAPRTWLYRTALQVCADVDPSARALDEGNRPR